MKEEQLLHPPDIKSTFYGLASLAILILVLIYFENIIKPIVVAALIWFIIKEFKNMLGKIKIKGRSLPGFWRGFFATVLLILVVIGIFEIISANTERIADEATVYREKLADAVKSLSSVINDPQILKYLQNGVQKINFAEMVANLINSLTSLLGSFAVVIVYLIFLIMEESLFKHKIEILFPSQGDQYNKFNNLLQKIDKSVRAYLSSMIFISLITAVVSYIALLIMDVDFPVLWAFLIFILNFIPYIGPFISSSLPALLALVQFGDLMQLLYVFLVLEVIQVILGNFIQPRMMGKSMNISGLVVLVSLAFWGSIWGIEGMILAVPMASITIIILGQIPKTRGLAILLSEKGDVGDK